MSYRYKIVSVTMALVFVLVMGCVSTTPETPAPAPGATTRQVEQSVWETLVAAARKEGKVNIATSMPQETNSALQAAFSGKFGISLEFLTGRSPELHARLLAERKAGINSTDLLMTGPPSPLVILKPEGALQPLDSKLMLPEVIDGKAWWGGKLLWIDPEHYQLGFLAYPQQSLFVNTDSVRPDQIKSYRDLLNPEWKGKMAINDPTLFGAGNAWFTAMAEGMMSLDFLRDVGKQNPIIVRDQRLQVEWVARGRYPVGIGLAPEMAYSFIKAGSPMKAVIPAEGVYLTVGGGCMALLARDPHPSATKVFVNWFLSREGQAMYSRIAGEQSARTDVPTDFLEPYAVRQEGANYFPAIALPYQLKKVEHQETARKIWGHLLK
ncbi:MAG: extracellular solute-binding protein [Chloroflexi bacterium]|nr:extracellular solute-binding protein [Chloroflexota bacterium]